MISVVIATKNGSKHIKRAIDSVLIQSIQDLEVIVVNDASTDETVTILNEICAHDSRVRVITNQKSVGPGISRHVGIRESKNELIAFIDDDDEWVSKEKLAIQKAYFDSNNQAVLVGSAKNNFINEDGTPYPIRRDTQPETDAQIRKEMLWRNPFLTSSVMIEKTGYLEVGGFSPLFLAEDYDLWMRMGEHGIMANIQDCTINYTVRKESASSTRRQEMNKIVLSLIKNYRKEYPANYYINLLKAYARVWLFNLKNFF